MGFRGNNILHRNHFRKDWQRRVKTWFDQPGRKKSRRVARERKAATLGVRPTELLRPAVRCPTLRYNRRLRAGRGFTFEELKLAGVPRKQARSIGIAVDHRRRNRSEDSLKLNADRLKAYKDRLILFPRNAKKPKKGDTEASELKADTTRTLRTVLPLPPSHVAEKPRAITAEERDFDAYATLRTARADARYAGVRKIRQQKKDEAEAAARK